MKKILLPYLVFTILAVSSLHSQSFLVDNEKSTVFWLGKKVTGEHYGYINISKGKMSIKDNQIVSGNFIIDMNSMTCTDIENASMNKKLLEHLTSDDFFGTKSYPNATLEVESSTKFKDNKSTVTGLLSIKGKSERISFDVTKSGNTFTANLEIDRSKFNVRYGSTSFFDSLGNRAIDDIFTLKINLVVDSI